MGIGKDFEDAMNRMTETQAIALLATVEIFMKGVINAYQGVKDDCSVTLEQNGLNKTAIYKSEMGEIHLVVKTNPAMAEQLGFGKKGDKSNG